jgi:hypothetical protein
VISPEERERAAAYLRTMIMETEGATGIDAVDLLEEAIDEAYERGYNKGRADELAVQQ